MRRQEFDPAFLQHALRILKRIAAGPAHGVDDKNSLFR
jgi:hypothetical protein